MFVKGCFSPNVKLIPDQSSILSPISYRRIQDFYIISIIELNCDKSLLMNTKWTIKKCIPICSNEIQISETIITIYSELYIPAKSLQIGIYQLELTAAMTAFPSLSTSSSVYVRITPLGVTPNLIQLGTSMITSGYEQDLVFNPGAFSVDIDGNPFNASVS